MASDELLAGSGLALYEDRNLCRSHLCGHLKDALHVLTRRDDRIGVEPASDLAPQEAILVLQTNVEGLEPLQRGTKFGLGIAAMQRVADQMGN